MGDIGIPEILFILGIALLIFGPGKLADLGKGLGEGIRGFKSAMNGEPEKSDAPASAAQPESSKEQVNS